MVPQAQNVENFLLNTSVGEVFIQTIASDVALLTKKLNLIGIKLNESRSVEELPDLDDHWFINLELDIGNALQLVFSVADHEAALQLIQGLSQLLRCPASLVRYGIVYRIYIAGIVTKQYEDMLTPQQ